MKTVTYDQIKQLAADLAGFPRDKLPTSDATMLRAFFAAELPDMWNREAWPELCDHLEQVTLDANNCFDLREGDADEMGDILAVIIGGNPLTSTLVSTIPKDQVTRLNERVHLTMQPGSAVPAGASSVYVDWQTPAPDLLDSDLDDEEDLNAYELPARFKLPLAARGAAMLLDDENPQKAGMLRATAELEISKQASRLVKPWWRR